MKLLFITQSARVIQDYDGGLYLNSHMNRNTIKRYSDICSELHMIIRDSGIRCSKEEAQEKYDVFPVELAVPTVGANPYLSISEFTNLKKRKFFFTDLQREINWADKVIVASATGFYAQKAISMCKARGIDYLLLVGGFAFETNWSHSLKGKIVAPLNEYNCKKNLSEAPFALYVTKKELQKRYPCGGKTIGCSDVEIYNLSDEIVENRLKKIENFGKNRIIIGTAANLNVKSKGHKYVIKALAELKKQGITNIEYQLIGGGSSDGLNAYTKKCNVVDQVVFLGACQHEQVYDWLDNIDIYIQPSFSEGLCRSVVEAMSRACPVVCSDSGGNVELCQEELLFSAGNVKEIVRVIRKILNKETMKEEALRSYKLAGGYSKEYLDSVRDKFLSNYMNNGE